MKAIERSVRAVVVAAVLSLGGVACTAILGTFEVSESTSTDAGGDVASPDANGSDAGDDADGPKLPGAVQVTAGARHSCAIANGNKVYCWGDNSAGQLGSPVAALARSPVPVEVKGLPPVKQISAGLFHTCAVEQANPRVWCWGKNDCGQLGRGSVDTTEPTPLAITSTDAGTEVEAVEVAGGDTHTCAVNSGGAIYCWGCNNVGQIGPNATNLGSPAPVVAVNGNNQAQTSAVGPQHSCAVMSSINGSGRVSLGCWGTEEHGAFGDGKSTAFTSPAFVEAAIDDAGANGVVRVAAGEAHTCATDADQKLFCWGLSDFGQAGPPPGATTPTAISPPVKAAQVAAAGSFTCFVTPLKEVYCFGNNEAGQLGRGSQDGQPHAAPDAVQALRDPSKALAAGFVATGRDHACAITLLQTVVCWGANSDGQIGDGTTGGNRTSPVSVLPPAPGPLGGP